MRFLTRFLPLVLTFCLLTSCGQVEKADTLRINGQTMGTTWSLVMRPHPGEAGATELQQKLQERLDRINGLMSTYDPASEVSRFNDHAGTGWFAVSEETARVVALSQEISRFTDGAFDVTVGPLVELWGFGAVPRGEALPTDRQVEATRARVGFGHLDVRLRPAALKKGIPGLRIDLSAIAKGYAADALAELLHEQGVGDYLVEVGGELRIAGLREEGAPWRIAIETPREDLREVAAVFHLTDTGLATSGNYRNFFIEDGQRYAHTLDPSTGRPVRTTLASATVLAPACARADALATALMVMGAERARAFSERHGIAAYLFVHEQTELAAYPTPAFTARVDGAGR